MAKLIFILLLYTTTLCSAAPNWLVRISWANVWTNSFRTDDASGHGNYVWWNTNHTTLSTNSNFVAQPVAGPNGSNAARFRVTDATEYTNFYANLPGFNPASFPGYVMGDWGGITNLNGGLDNMPEGTISVWVKFVLSGAQGPGSTILSTIESGTSNTWELGRFNVDSSRTAFKVIDPDGVERNIVTVPADEPTNVWLSYIVTFSTSANAVKFYTNGELAASATMNAPYYRTPQNGTHWIAVGVHPHDGFFKINLVDGDATPNNGWLYGDLGPIDIAAGALSAGEVRSLYNGTLGAPPFSGSYTLSGSYTIHQ